jgi:hypothetical protein
MARSSHVYFARNLSSACHTILWDINMSAPVNKQPLPRKMQSLKIQREVLDLIQNRHLYGMRCTHDVEYQQIHPEIAELMRKTKELNIPLRKEGDVTAIHIIKDRKSDESIGMYRKHFLIRTSWQRFFQNAQ